MNFRFLLLFVLLLVIGGAYGIWMTGASSVKKSQMQTVTLQGSENIPPVSMPSEIISSDWFPSYAKNDGVVKKILVKVGDNVKKGQTLAILNLDQRELSFYYKIKKLIGLEFYSVYELEKALGDISHLKQKGYYNHLEALMKKNDVLGAASDYFKYYKDMEKYLTDTGSHIIRASEEGVVAGINWKVGDFIVASKQENSGISVRTYDPKFQVRTEFTDDMIGYVKHGDPVEFAFPLIDEEPLTGIVRGISEEVYHDQKTDVRFFPVTSDIHLRDDLSFNLKKGMKVIMTHHIEKENKGVWVPRSALDLYIPDSMIHQEIDYTFDPDSSLGRAPSNDSAHHMKNNEVRSEGRAKSPLLENVTNKGYPEKSNLRHIHLLMGNQLVRALVEVGPGNSDYAFVKAPILEGAQAIVHVEKSNNWKNLLFK